MNKEHTDLEMQIMTSIEDEYLNFNNIEQEFNNDLLNHALHYARIGYPVFPLQNLIGYGRNIRCSCKEWEDCERQGKHPRTRYGLKEATTDENKIIYWWEKYPQANIGLLTGKESGIFVLNIDIKDGGEYCLEELQDYYRAKDKENNLIFDPLPATLTTITGSGGRHLYFRYDLDYDIRGSASEIDFGLDVRANKNYIIAPPSKHISGNPYKWFGANIPIEEAPQWLMYEVLAASKSQSNSGNENKSTSIINGKRKIKDGEGRHKYFFRHVSGLVNSFPEEEVLKRASVFNNEYLEPPFTERKVEYQVKYLYKKYGGLNTKKNLEQQIPMAK